MLLTYASIAAFVCPHLHVRSTVAHEAGLPPLQSKLEQRVRQRHAARDDAPGCGAARARQLEQQGIGCALWKQGEPRRHGKVARTEGEAGGALREATDMAGGIIVRVCGLYARTCTHPLVAGCTKTRAHRHTRARAPTHTPPHPHTRARIQASTRARTHSHTLSLSCTHIHFHIQSERCGTAGPTPCPNASSLAAAPSAAAAPQPWGRRRRGRREGGCTPLPPGRGAHGAAAPWPRSCTRTAACE
jgi:hypothetical protein